MKVGKFILVVFLIVLLIGIAQGVRVESGVEFKTDDTNATFYIADTFNCTNITVYSDALSINGGNLSVSNSTQGVNISLENLDDTPPLFNFTSNATINVFSIFNNFANYSVIDDIMHYIFYQSGAEYQSNTSSGSSVTFTDIAADSYSLQTNFPTIISWSNNDTNDNTLDITIDASQNVNFNASADQTITTWTWKKDGVDQSHNYDNITLSWILTGAKTITVTATNANGTSSEKQWNATVNCATPYWYDSDFAKRKNITIDYNYVNGSQTYHPVYINITDSDLIGDTQLDGDDIIFVDVCSMTKISDMKERSYNSATGHLEAWFNVPSISGDSNTTIQMYYGNTEASNTEDKNATWNSNFELVYLFAEDSGTYVNDSSGNNNNGTGTNIAWGRLGLDLPGSNEHVSIPNFIGQDDDWTIIARYIQDTRNPFTQTSNSIIVSMASGTGFGRSILYIYDSVFDTYKTSSYIDGIGNPANTAITVGNTHNIAFSQSGTEFNYYLNGTSDGSFSTTANAANGNIILFDTKTALGNGCFDGTFDYLLWASTTLSQGTIETIHNNTNSPSTFTLFSAEEGIEDSPSITSWANNKTNDNTLDFTINVSESVNLNATANQPITTWNWYEAGIDQSNNYDNITLTWAGRGNKIVIVNGTNANGTTQSKQWNITVQDPSWYDVDWYNVKYITINQTMVNQSIGNIHYTMLVEITDTDLRDKAQADGDDIIFIASDNTTQLAHYISTYNSTSGYLKAYVNVTDISNITQINMYYNNSAATNSENKTNTWDTDVKGVWLMDESTGSYANDSSGNNNNGTLVGTPDWVTDDLDFNGSSDYVDILDSVTGGHDFIDLSEYITVFTEINPDVVTGTDTYWRPNNTIIELRTQQGAGSHVPFSFGIDDSKLFIGVSDDYASSFDRNAGIATLSVDTDYIVAFTINDDNWNLYLDGVNDNSSTFSQATGDRSVGATICNMQIGSRSTDAGAKTSSMFDGAIESLLIYNRTFSYDEISTLYNNTNSPLLFITLGEELPGGDSTPPTYSSIGHSTVEAGDSCIFSTKYDDDTALESTGWYIFSTNNTGSWVNESLTYWSTTPQWANVTKILNTVHDFIVGYRWYAEDDAGNTNNTAIYTLTVQDTTPPASITSLTSSTGNYWHNWTWTDPTDADFNYTTVYINNSWVVNTTNEYYNLSASAHNTSIINTKTVDTTGNINPTWTNHTSNIPNNLVTITNTSDWSGNEGQTVYVDYDSTDNDSDTPTFSCNRTDLFTDFNTSTGIGNWTTNYTVAGNHTIDFGADDGYGSEDNYTMNITVDDYGTPGAPTGLSNTTGNYWVNFTWTAGANTDTFNVSQNSTWVHGTTTAYNNSTVGAHGWSSISVYGYNSTSEQLSSAISDNVQVPNNAITISNISANYTLDEGDTLSIDADITDIDNDSPTFDDNSSDWDINISTGIVSWVTADGDDGTYNWYINVIDGYGGTDTQVINVTVNNTEHPVTYSNESVSPVNVLQGATSTITIDVVSPNATIDIVYVKIQGTNYSMSNTVDNTWSYDFSSTFVGKHYISNYYSQDNYSDWNSTTSTSYINVLTSSGGGGGGAAPTATATPTATPTTTPTVIPPKDDNITIPNVFKIITGEGFSMFKINFGVNNPVYSKTIKYGDIESCAVLDSDFVACDASNEKVRVIVKPQLEGVYNYDISYVQLIDHNETVHDIPVEIIVLDLMGWVNIPNMQVNGLPDILFEKEPITNDVIGMRLWWVFGLMGIGLYRMNKK